MTTGRHDDDTPRTAPQGDRLALSDDEMRRTGHAVVEALVALAGQPDPVIRRASPDQMAALLHTTAPEEPLGVDAVMRRLLDDVLPHASKVGHPGYFAYIPGSTTWPAALTELTAAVANVYCGSWMESAGPSQLELTVVEWFRSWLGMPEGTQGILVSGGSAANLTALAAARELRIGAMSDDVVVYCGDQAHSSVGRAARVLGFRPDQVRIVPTDDRFRMRVDALRTAVTDDLGAGRRPLAVVAAGGATNTGTVDPLGELADLCAELDVWLHVDAAYGGFAVLDPRGAAALAGIERADSVTLDPHKWLFQPMECGALLVREPGALERAFGVLPDYLADAAAHGDGVDFSDRGLQLTRSARSLKVWASLSAFGVGAFREAIGRAMDLAALAADVVDADPDLELMGPPSLGIVCLRRRIDGADEAATARANTWLTGALEETGRAMVSSTRLHGRYALRMCVLNHLTGEADVRWTLDFLARTPVPDVVLRPAGADTPELHPPVLSLLGADAQRLLERRSHVRRHAPGELVVARWAADRDLGLVVDGELEVSRDGRSVARLRSGDFFGEIAATDWGSGYGSLRTADVRAVTDAVVRLVPAEVLADLMAAEPRFRDHVMAVRAERLADQY